MNNKDFINAINKKFKYLEVDYLLTSIKVDALNNRLDVYFYNNKSFVRISYSEYEDDIYVLIGRMIDNNIPEYPVSISSDTVLNMFDFQDVLSIKKTLSSDAPKKLSTMKYLDKLAGELNEYGSDILKGDFKIFVELDKIVKSRLE